MRLIGLAVLSVFGLQSATLVQINAGSATDSNYSGGTKYTVASLSTQPEPYRAMRYGPSVSYSIPVVAGPLKVTLGFIEPRTETSSPAIGAGQRVFSVAINGAIVIPSLDLYVIAGSRVPYSTTFDIVQGAGPLSVQIIAASGKLAAVLSLIKVDTIDVQPPILLQCSGADSHIDPVTGKTYTADCEGLLWIKLPGISILGVRTSDTGTPPPAGSNQHWTQIR